MFRPLVAIIRFYHSTHLRLFCTIRVVACLMRRFEHQNPCWSIVPLYWVCVWAFICIGEPKSAEERERAGIDRTDGLLHAEEHVATFCEIYIVKPQYSAPPPSPYTHDSL